MKGIYCTMLLLALGLCSCMDEAEKQAEEKAFKEMQEEKSKLKRANSHLNQEFTNTD
mgnify:CR=1 FL=1